MVTVLIILVALLYVKPILLVVYIFIQWMNGAGKRMDNLFGKALTVPEKILNKITRGGCQRAAIYQMSTFPSNAVRKLYYKAIGCNIAKKVVFHFKTEIRCPWRLTVGEGTIIGDNAILDAREGLTLGRNVNLSSNVSIYTLQHNHRSPDFGAAFPDRAMAVVVGDRVWLGSNVVVLPGVAIGEGAVVCAGAVVTKDVAPYAVVAGIPARQVSTRPQVLEYEFSGKSCWFY